MEDEKKKAQIWVIGGGKGGTGKSFVTSGLAVQLASRGRKTILIDTDLGGANLHSFFGISNPIRALNDFFSNKTPLPQLVVNTSIPNIGLISGDVHSIVSNGLKYTQKQKLFRHVQVLDCDHILMDIGGGSHHNIIDTFLQADKMLVVIIPEITSIENMYLFIKRVFLRKLKNILIESGLKETAQTIWSQRETLGIRSLKELIDRLSGSSPYIAQIITTELAAFVIHIVLNQIKNEQQIQIGYQVCSVLKNLFGIQARLSGHIEYGESFWKAMDGRHSFWKTESSRQFATQLTHITDTLLQDESVKTIPPS